MDREQILSLIAGGHQVEIPFGEWMAVRTRLVERIAELKVRPEVWAEHQRVAHEAVLRKHDEVWSQSTSPDPLAIMAPKVGSGMIFSRARTFTVIDARTTL